MYSMLMKPVIAITPAVLAADNTPAAIDLQGYYAATILLHVGAGGITFTSTNKIEFKVTHSDDDVTYSTCDETDFDWLDSAELTDGATTDGIIKSIKAAHAAAAVYRINYTGGRRFLKILADFGGTHSSGTLIGAWVLKGHPGVASAVAA